MAVVMIRCHDLERAQELRALGFVHNTVTKVWKRDIPDENARYWKVYGQTHDVDVSVIAGKRILAQHRAGSRLLHKRRRWLKRQ